MSAYLFSSVAIGIANLLASFFNWYLFRDIEHRENTDLHRMDIVEERVDALDTDKV